MKSQKITSNLPKALLALIVVCGTLVSPLSQAQQIYRIIGSDGKITFSDQPPPAASNARVSPSGSGAAGGAANNATLPFELRQVASRYPVTLYTGDNCNPCTSARAMLTSRGIPFSERTVTTNQDAEALKRLSGDNSLPFATIGGQQLKGFSDSEWTQFLNAAGYPASSVLPANYRQSPATPLVAVSLQPAVPANTTAARPEPAAPVETQPAANNPAGIRF